MVNIVPNWTEIKGKVKSIVPHKKLSGYSVILVEVKQLSDVKGFKNLMAGMQDKEVSAIVSTAALDEKDIREGTLITCHLRITQSRENFVNPESIQEGS